MKKIMLAQAIPEPLIEYLKESLRSFYPPSPHESVVREYIEGCEGILVRTNTNLSRDTIMGADSLKVITRTGVGVDNVDVDAASERKIPVCYTPEANYSSVAEHVIAFLMMAFKNMKMLDREVRHLNWDIRNDAGAYDVFGKNIYILGYGRIGRSLGKFARFLGMNVYAYDPFLSESDVEDGVVLCSNLYSKLGEMDVLSIHMPLTDSTKGIVGEDFLKAMKDDAIILNVARGRVIDEEALCNELTKGRFRNVCLDVFSEEPIREDNPLLKFDRVIMTPHSAALTVECRYRMAEHSVRGMVDVLEGRRPEWVFNGWIYM